MFVFVVIVISRPILHEGASKTNFTLRCFQKETNYCPAIVTCVFHHSPWVPLLDGSGSHSGRPGPEPPPLAHAVILKAPDSLC